MGTIKPVRPVKLFTAMLSPTPSLFSEVRPALEAVFGSIDSESEEIPFTFTDFYNEEMGEGIVRKFYSFKKLVDPLYLAEAKNETNRIELDFACRDSGLCNRRINIDPGYISASNLILASVKERPHRIYIGKGIFAEITLYYKKKSFRPWEWSYKDYCSSKYIEYLNRLREQYTLDLKGI